MAIALSAGIQAILAFKEISLKTTDAYDIIALILAGLMLIFVGTLALESFMYLRKQK